MAADRSRRRKPPSARRGGVRVRTTLAAVVVVGVALLVGAVALVAAMQATLVGNLREATALRAAELAAVLEGGERPGFAVADPDEELVQVVDVDGTVVDASDNVAGRPPVAQLQPGQSERIGAAVGDDDLLAAASGAHTPDGRLTVIVARSVDDVAESTQVVTGLLAVGLPVLLGLVGVTTWHLVGRALAPVEGIRTEVEAISSAELHRRVPAPGGRDEVARLADTMNRMLGRLEGAQLRQRRFVADAAHELRSPVASIRQHAEVARAHPERSSLDALSGTVLTESLRIQRLVDDLLLLARADEGSLPLRRRSVDLDDLVFEEARRLRNTTDLRIDTERVSAGRVSGDPAGLARALRNIGDNAARHARSRVAFGLGEVDGVVHVDVDDDGPGVPVAARNRVLERFVRLDEGRGRDEGGAGLGLAIVAEVVAAHGGEVSVSDSPLGGARVEIRLPGLDDRPDG
jgi:signal transduction histidine kinase